MRTIKFRGKTKVGKEWVYGYVYETQIFIDGNPCQDVMIIDDFTIIPETIGQFTGLTDKNGKEIYEGDVIKSYRADLLPTVIVYDAPCYYPFVDEYWNMGWREEECEIIGNIHDNSEFLK